MSILPDENRGLKGVIMRLIGLFGVVAVLLALTGSLWAADVILNEYNAVDSNSFLGGGDSSADDNGGRAYDTYFGRVQGNGGDWFELVVIKDHLDMRKWHLDIFDSGLFDKTLDLTNHAIWSDLRSGTIITVSESVPSDISYNPAAGDWWINVQASDTADGLYIEAQSFKVSNNSWQLRIRNAAGTVVFGPAGEGISPTSGIGATNIFRLQTDPSASITPTSSKYSDGSNFSTFGSPNRWGAQDFSTLRNVVTPEVEAITVLDPNGPVILTAGTSTTIHWQSTGAIAQALVEFSLDKGETWCPVYPPNVGNTGHYTWLVPLVGSTQCLVRVANADRPAVYDTSKQPFSIVLPAVYAGLWGKSADMQNVAVLTYQWLDRAYMP
jgi:hypothetical protein